MNIELPKGILSILESLKMAGYKAYAVGGAVRDALLGIEPVDWDIATAASAEEIAALFPDSRLIGEKYGVVRVEKENTIADIAAMRIDGKYSDYRRPDEVILTERIEEDLARRDFTINGMAYSAEEGLIDPFEGQRDLKAHMLRAIGKAEDRFAEDPLRILRGLRFSGQLGFDIALETFTSMQKTVHLLGQISMDRRREEFDKLLVSANAGKALRMCISAGVMPFLLADCYPPDGEREEANFSLMMQKIDESSPELEVRRTMLFCCVEKRKAVKAAKALGIDGESVKKLERNLGSIRELLLASDRYEIKRLVSPLGRAQFEATVKLLLEYKKVFGGENGLIESRCLLLSDIQKSGEPLFLDELAVNGEDLLKAGFPEGKEIGDMLDAMLQTVLKDPGMNNKQKLLKSIKRPNLSLRDRIRGINKK